MQAAEDHCYLYGWKCCRNKARLHKPLLVEVKFLTISKTENSFFQFGLWLSILDMMCHLVQGIDYYAIFQINVSAVSCYTFLYSLHVILLIHVTSYDRDHVMRRDEVVGRCHRERLQAKGPSSVARSHYLGLECVQGTGKIRNLINVAFHGRTTKYVNQYIRQAGVYNRESSHSFIHTVLLSFILVFFISFCQLFQIPSIGKTHHNAKTPLALGRFDELHSEMFWRGDYFMIKDNTHYHPVVLLYDD